MATGTYAMGGVTSPDNWTLGAGASKVAAVAEPDDDATSYIASGATINTAQAFTVTVPLNVGDTITQVSVDLRAMRGGASNADFTVTYAFTPDGGGSQTGTSGAQTTTASWGDFNYTHGSLSVLWGSAFVVTLTNTQNRDVQVSSLSVTITYTATGGGASARTVTIGAGMTTIGAGAAGIAAVQG